MYVKMAGHPKIEVEYVNNTPKNIEWNIAGDIFKIHFIIKTGIHGHSVCIIGFVSGLFDQMKHTSLMLSIFTASPNNKNRLNPLGFNERKTLWLCFLSPWS